MNERGASLREAGPRRILVRGVNWLGDAVMTTPALTRLRGRFPEAQITLLTHEKLEPIWRLDPRLNQVVTFAPDDSPWRVARTLRQPGFDVALIFPNSPRSALEAWFARIPVRVGYGGGWRKPFLTEAVPRRANHVPMRKRTEGEVKALTSGVGTANSPARILALSPSETAAHQMHEYLNLCGRLGASTLPVEPELHMAEDEMTQVAARFGLTGAKVHSPGFLGINPGAEYGPAKRWPAEKFVRAAVEIRKRTQSECLVFGGANDKPITSEIVSRLKNGGCPAQDLAGKTSLRELMALLRLCRVLLTNDSGPMHVAAALGMPVVVPFGSTSPVLTGPGIPGDTRHRLVQAAPPCAPCFLRECPIDFRCMENIPVALVVDAVVGAGFSSPAARP
jgi:heptosyltransferase-2